jgi:PPE-repeat protein
LLASAGAWNALNTTYTETADELTALLGAVQSGTWDGPTEEAYVAAHAPYLEWLAHASANSAAMAVQQETAATAYTTALAAMPTLLELAANHATHAALVATNFFGINTIPIALNEADYARMWVQAATTMGTYHATSTAAVAATPQTTPAPQIVKSDATSDSLPANGVPTNFDQAEALLMKLIQSYIKVLGPNGSAVTTNPTNLQQLFGATFHTQFPPPPGYDIADVIYFEQQFLTQMSKLNFNNFFTYVFIAYHIASFIRGRIFDVLITLKFLAYELPQLLPYAIPPAVASLGAATGVGAVAGAGGVAGFAGLAGLAAIPTGAEAIPIVVEPVPPAPTVASAPAPASPAPATPAAATPAPAPAIPTPGPPPPGGVPPSPTIGAENLAYLVGGLPTATRSSTSAKRKTPTSDTAPAPSAAATNAATQNQQAQRRRRRAGLRGHGNEYMDMNVQVEPDWDTPEDEQPRSTVASDHGAGSLGFTGAAPRDDGPQAGGLTTLPDDTFGGGPAMPMRPSTWKPDGSSQAEEPDGDS